MTKKIGLLGGSFNPAHEGHLYISQQALEILGLDEIWWLVSPQNPLKSVRGMQSFEERFASAEAVTKNEPKIIISNFEQQNANNLTYQTIAALHKRHPDDKFVWLMGADNLVIFDKWQNWQEIFHLIPIAVFDRGNFRDDALKSLAAITFVERMLSSAKSKQLAESSCPVWSFFDITKHPASSTKIRNNVISSQI